MGLRIGDFGLRIENLNSSVAYQLNPLSKIQNPKPANERMMWTEYSHLARACQILFRLRISDCGLGISDCGLKTWMLFSGVLI